MYCPVANISDETINTIGWLLKMGQYNKDVKFGLSTTDVRINAFMYIYVMPSFKYFRQIQEKKMLTINESGTLLKIGRQMKDVKLLRFNKDMLNVPVIDLCSCDCI